MFLKKWIVSCYLKVLGTGQLVLVLIWQAPYVIYVINWKRRQVFQMKMKIVINAHFCIKSYPD